MRLKCNWISNCSEALMQFAMFICNSLQVRCGISLRLQLTHSPWTWGAWNVRATRASWLTRRFPNAMTAAVKKLRCGQFGFVVEVILETLFRLHMKLVNCVLQKYLSQGMCFHSLFVVLTYLFITYNNIWEIEQLRAGPRNDIGGRRIS